MFFYFVSSELYGCQKLWYKDLVGKVGFTSQKYGSNFVQDPQHFDSLCSLSVGTLKYTERGEVG
jgi:hypothetical protein